LKRNLWAALRSPLAWAVISVFSALAHAQKFDLAAGLSTIEAPGISSANGKDHQPVTLSGGAYIGASGDVRVFRRVSIGAEVFWRGSQAQNYNNAAFNYRPIFWNVNAVYAAKLARRTYLELVAGVGELSTQYYTAATCAPYPSCSIFKSANHLDGDFGGGIRFYPRGGWFIRPEGRVYLINNNWDFSANYATRFGASIGYTFGRH